MGILKLKDLYHALVWYYHNEPRTFNSWAKSVSDMWPDVALTAAERVKSHKWKKKEGKYLPKVEVRDAICFYLHQTCYTKLFFLLKNPKKSN